MSGIQATPNPLVEQPREFTFSVENLARAQAQIAKYPPGKQQSAVMPLLDLAQRQHGGWIPIAAMDYIAGLLDMPAIRVYEVVSFYTMYNQNPVGRHHVQVCTTTPCWLRGSAQIVDACKAATGLGFGETSADGTFALSEVECLGACVNAPMIQINDDFYEDLTPERVTEILNALKRGESLPPGSQTGRQGSLGQMGPTSLQASLQGRTQKADA
jgi:NADH dehydrogenase (ubiquinone) flavoprotein 2